MTILTYVIVASALGLHPAFEISSIRQRVFSLTVMCGVRAIAARNAVREGII